MRGNRTGRRSRLPESVILVVALIAVAGLSWVLIGRGLSSRPVARPASPLTGPTHSPSPQVSPPPSPLPGISAASIFDTPPDLSKVDAARTVTMVVTGDVIPARKVNEEALRRQDFLWPFRATADYLKSGDFVFINLESPLVANCVAFDSGFKPFCGDPRFIDGLKFAGATVANLSNNHLQQYGQPGTDSTIKLLTDNGIQPTGLGLRANLTVKGVRFAFLGFNGVTAGGPINRAELKREIEEARPTADVVIVQFHWGREYVLTPLTAGNIAPDDPREIGHLAIDDGADLIIGNHPHAVQGLEIYNGKLITYAHGNFVFDQMWTPDPGQEDPRNGVVGKYTFVDGRLAAVTYKPVRIYDYGQPRFLTGPYGDYVLSLMRASTELIAAGKTAPPPSPAVAPPG